MTGATQGRTYTVLTPAEPPTLAPCPFCGGEARIIDMGNCQRNWTVTCDTCGFYGPKPPNAHLTPYAAALAWNTRLPSTCGSNKDPFA